MTFKTEPIEQNENKTEHFITYNKIQIGFENRFYIWT